jgi:hypothetical protein
MGEPVEEVAPVGSSRLVGAGATAGKPATEDLDRLQWQAGAEEVGPAKAAFAPRGAGDDKSNSMKMEPEKTEGSAQVE